MRRNIIKSFFGGMAFTCAVAALSLVPAQPVTAAVGVPSAMVDLTSAAESAVNSVVYIKVTMASKQQQVEYFSPFDDFFGDFFGFGNGQKRRQQVETPKRKASGSGVIISSDGYIVTNNHVVQDADEILVKLNDKKEYKGRIIGTDKTTDLALLKVEAEGLPAIPIGDSDKLKLGEWVLAVGNPFNLTSTVTAGIVSAKSRSLNANDVESFIQTDAAINAGNSGGALVNAKGELVGINAMLYSQTGSFSGYGFAIPTTIMNKVVDDLKKYGTVQRALIGIQGQDLNVYTDGLKNQGKDVPDFGVINGIYVGKVVDDGAGAAAGLKEGDVITAIDGKPLKAMAELQEYLANKRPGDKVALTYMRNKEKKTVHVTLKNAQGNTKVVKTADLDVLGANIREVNAEEKKQLEISYGLKVSKVGNGALRKARITDGFIILNANDEPMRTVSDLQEAVKSASTSSDPVLYIKGIYPTGKKAYFVVELSSDE
jgi:Do/DeqQ family serine protease